MLSASTIWNLNTRDKVFAIFNYLTYNNSVTDYGGAIMLLKG